MPRPPAPRARPSLRSRALDARDRLPPRRRAAGLDLVELRPGTWSGREEGLGEQDLMIARA